MSAEFNEGSTESKHKEGTLHCWAWQHHQLLQDPSLIGSCGLAQIVQHCTDESVSRSGG